MVQYFTDIYHSVSSAFKGMGVTIKHIVRKPVTLQYPDERWVLPDRFRGFVHNNIIRCNACLGCAKACPVSCIYIETEGKAKDRYMTRYAVDFNKCIWCGLCTDPCPTEAVTMSHDYDHSLYFRRNLVYEFVPADKPVPCHKDKRREMGYFVEEKPQPEDKKPAAAPKADATAKPAAAPATEPAADQPAPEKNPVAAEPVSTGSIAGNPGGAATDSPGAVDAPAPESSGPDPAAEPPNDGTSADSKDASTDDKGVSK